MFDHIPLWLCEDITACCYMYCYFRNRGKERRQREGEETEGWRGDRGMERRGDRGRGEERRQREGEETEGGRGDGGMERRQRDREETEGWRGEETEGRGEETEGEVWFSKSLYCTIAKRKQITVT